MLIITDGRRLEGQFKNNKLEGQGIMIYPDGRKHNVVQTGVNTFKIIPGT